MPRRDDIHKILLIGSGPIVIGQACEFDYSGTQACKALREEGFRVVLLNSNPATIMTDPEVADRTYVEPITVENIEKILLTERAGQGGPIDAVLPTLGGQTALNAAAAAAEAGLFERFGVRMIGADREAIHKAEDRTAFRDAMLKIGLDVPRSGVAHTMEEAEAVVAELGLPLVLRPAYTLGGSGGGIARTREEFRDIVQRGLAASRVSEVLIEESLVGWKEFELEVMRDRADNVVIICSIENIDPMGVHTGDSITVAPQQTLTDKEYQRMRNAAIAIIREIGVETGGSNVQFAVDPATGRQVVIEMNPRVSRSSALASKATGYPIAKIATKLAVGYTLDELPNDITRKTPASFEPVLDYVVVKIPRFAFEKFPEADETLTTSMKSVGEAMAIGRTFKQALQKCIRSMEIRRFGLGLDGNDKWLAARNDSLSHSKGEGRGEGYANTPAQLWHRLPAGDPGGSEAATKQPAWHGLPARETHRLEASGTTESGVTPELSVTVESDVTASSHRLEAGATTDFKPTTEIGIAADSNAVPMAGPREAEPPGDWEESNATRWPIPESVLTQKLSTPCQGRLYYIRYAFKSGWPLERVQALTHIDPWFLHQMQELAQFEDELLTTGDADETARRELFAEARRHGYSEPQLRHVRRAIGLGDAAGSNDAGAAIDDAQFRSVDTCAGEFEAYTPYYYSAHDRPFVPSATGALPGGAASPRGVVSPGGAASPGGTGVSPVSPPIQTYGPQAHAPQNDDLRLGDRPRVVILGGGPNRIGQGIEFDYCCVHAVQAARAMGFETVMVNSNPETVSTDYDTADVLFFEPLTREDVLRICRRLGAANVSSPLKGEGGGEGGGVSRMLADAQPAQATRTPALSLGGRGSKKDALTPALSLEEGSGSRLLRGVIVQFGGQTPLNLAQALADAGVPILGTSPAAIHLAENREAFARVLRELHLRQPANGIATDTASAKRIAAELGYPVLLRPSFVLGGRAMQKCNIEADLERYMQNALAASDRSVVVDDDHPILIDKFLDEATEVDVDCVADFGGPSPTGGVGRCVVCGVMEHIEEAGIHSGDSSCALPPYSLPPLIVDELTRQAEVLARRLKLCGLMNIQFAVKNNAVYVLEVNPRASRTIPFVSKATGVPWARIATRVMLGEPLDRALAACGADRERDPRHVAVKSVVFPFNRFPGVDCVLGPEMRSTGEVMGIDRNFPLAFAKAMEAAGQRLPTGGSVLVSVNDTDKPAIVMIAQQLAEMGFRIFSTLKTRDVLAENGINAELVYKLQDAGRPFLIDLISEGKLDLLINTPIHWGSATSEGKIRAAAVRKGIPLITTIAGARAAVTAIRALRRGPLGVRALQDYTGV